MVNTYIEWAVSVLQQNGYKLQSNAAKIIQDNPWSVVSRFDTDHGFVFLKQVPEKLSLESAVINLLHTKFNARVPLIITETQGCFLMKDAGIQLHQYFKKNFKADILIHTMHEYIKLQITVINQTKGFLNLGVPDWRLENLPMLYRDLINQEELLIKDGLNNEDLNKLKKLASKFSTLCEHLLSYEIKDTFGHADFHDRNILINPDTEETTIIDLGEVVITHPLFSFNNCLHMAKENFSLSDKQYRELQLACIEPWLKFESQKRIFAILSIIEQCWSIHAVLGEYRLINSVDKKDFQKLNRQGRLANKLRYWLNQ